MGISRKDLCTFFIYLAQFFLEWETFQTNIV